MGVLALQNIHGPVHFLSVFALRTAKFEYVTSAMRGLMLNRSTVRAVISVISTISSAVGLKLTGAFKHSLYPGVISLQITHTRS